VKEEYTDSGSLLNFYMAPGGGFYAILSPDGE